MKRIFIILLFAFSGWCQSIPDNSALSSAQIEAKLKQDYEGKNLIIRHFYQGKSLEYNTAGEVPNGKPGPWTLYGRVKINKIRFKNDKLELESERICVMYLKSLGFVENSCQSKLNVGKKGNVSVPKGISMPEPSYPEPSYNVTARA